MLREHIERSRSISVRSNHACMAAISFNSWDRQAWFWEENGAAHFKPELQLIRRNLILNKDYQYNSGNSE